MSHVYIHYNYKDGTYVSDLVSKLVQANVYVWFDQWDVHPGDDWATADYEGYHHAKAVLAINLSSSLKPIIYDVDTSIYVTKNIETFPLEDKEKHIIYQADDPNIISKIVQALPDSVKDKMDGHKPKQKKTKSKGYIFISYSIEDLKFVEKLRKFFGDKGYAYWDYQETHRKYEMPFHLEIEEAIKGAKAVASVVSPDWKRSKWATREFLFSEQISKTNFVLIARQVGATLLYADKTFIEFFNNEEKGFEILDKALRREGLID